MALSDPTWTIIVPTYERPARLADCLASLARLDYPRDRFEVIVVDDGSRAAPTDDVASSRAQLRVDWIRQEHAGPAVARNAGAQAARGTFLAFTDDDCLVTPSWLTAMEARLRETPQALIGGRTLNAFPDNLYSMVSQLLTDALYDYHAGHPECLRFFTSNNLAVSRAHFQAVGGFDPAFPSAAGEDREFCARWTWQGYPLIYEVRAVVHHRHWLTPKTFLRQQFGYGRGACRFHRICAQRQQGGHRVGIEFWRHLLHFSFQKLGGRRRMTACGLVVLSQIAIAGGLATACFHSPNGTTQSRGPVRHSSMVSSRSAVPSRTSGHNAA